MIRVNLTVVSLCVFAGLISRANAQSMPLYESVEAGATPFVLTWEWLSAGSVVSTGTLSPIPGSALPDTVLTLIKMDLATGELYYVASNDNCRPKTRASCVTVPDSGQYLIWIRARSDYTGGYTDLRVDGVPIYSSLRFGGATRVYQWQAGTRIAAVAQEPAQWCGGMLCVFPLNDYIMILTDGGEFVSINDNSGTNFYPSLTVSTAPTGTGRIHLARRHDIVSAVPWLIADRPTLNTDPDQDGLSDALEQLIGTNPNSSDTDGDGLYDNIEVYGDGVDSPRGFSLTEYADPLLSDVFVEVDGLEADGVGNPLPRLYQGLGDDASAVFQSDAANGTRLHVFLDDGVKATSFDVNGQPTAWQTGFSGYDVVGLDLCPPGWSNCISLPDLKSQWMSYPSYFHYVAYTKDYLVGPGCRSGYAEVSGNDVLLVRNPSQCGGNFTEKAQLGTFMHELGHNLGLSEEHNGNDQSVLVQNSEIHLSVMNYRYQKTCVPVGGDSVCTYSSEDRCLSLLEACLSPKLGCTCVADCDCNVDEWAALDVQAWGGANWADGASHATYGLDSWPRLWVTKSEYLSALSRFPSDSPRPKSLRDFTSEPQRRGVYD